MIKGAKFDRKRICLDYIMENPSILNKLRMSPREFKAYEWAMGQNDLFTAKDVQLTLDVSATTATKIVKDLTDKGFLVKTVHLLKDGYPLNVYKCTIYSNIEMRYKAA